MNILDKINKLRISRGWSIYKMAEECNITPSTISNMFARQTLPSISTLISLCEGFNITLSQFFAEDEKSLQTEDEMLLLKNYRKLDTKNKEAISQLIKNIS